MSDEPVELPIDGELDLHLFSPKDVKDLVPEYLLACIEAKIYQVRIVHGKGKGVLRNIVRSILEDSELVEQYWSESGAGSWGATIAKLVEPEELDEIDSSSQPEQ